jgi:hypothetical protein
VNGYRITVQYRSKKIILGANTVMHQIDAIRGPVSGNIRVLVPAPMSLLYYMPFQNVSKRTNAET